jgi:hypothetical protein
MAMPLLASFNFDIPLGAVAIVVGATLTFLIFLGSLRSLLLGSLFGGLICGGLWLVISLIGGPKGVPLLEPWRMGLALLFAIGGLVLGAIAGVIGEAFRGSQAKAGVKKTEESGPRLTSRSQ